METVPESPDLPSVCCETSAQEGGLACETRLGKGLEQSPLLSSFPSVVLNIGINLCSFILGGSFVNH